MKTHIVSLGFALCSLSLAALPTIEEIYQELHSYPEVSFQEKETSRRVAKHLREAGFEVTEGVGGYGVVGVLKNGPGKTVLLRADLDALPVEEQTGLKYASKNKGAMHACGHDVHMTNLISTARELNARKKEWQGTVVLIGQPAEEKGEGSKRMLADGLFTRFPKPDFALAFHVTNDAATGKVSYLAGPSMATADSVDITLFGRGGHGAMPHETIDPITMAAQFVVDIQSLVARERDPNEVSVVSVGSLHCGTKHNVIPEECKIQITVRTFVDAERKRIFDGITRKAKAVAQSFKAPEPYIDFSSDSTPALVNDPKLVARLVPVLKKVLGDENVFEGRKTTTAEDFARYGIAGVPSAMFRLGSISPQRLKKMEKAGYVPGLHSSKYYPDIEESVATGTKSFVAAVIELTR